jgi:DNA-binding transcriptional MerR regulator
MSTPTPLPPIPPKRYFTIGEVSELCGVKPHVLRYWEQEFTQLRPLKRRGNRRYYQHHEVLLIRRIRELLYDEGFTIHGARNRLAEWAAQARAARRAGGDDATAVTTAETARAATSAAHALQPSLWADTQPPSFVQDALLDELRAIAALLDSALLGPVPTSAQPPAPNHSENAV